MTPFDAEFVALQTALSGRFSIERELGRGGMGIVYLARDVQLQRPVAIKLLAPELAARPDMRKRFLREAHLAAQCFHPHIVPIHSVEESGTLAWFVMAYVRGESLAERVRRTGALSPENVRRLAQDIGWALSYAHERGVVHRDVKPENILIDAGSERFLLADFGIAQQQQAPLDVHLMIDGGIAPAGRTHAPLRPSMDATTTQGRTAGTPRYMAPEQALGGSIDGRADLYALGATLFFAATARAPFDATASAALIFHHAATPAPAVRTFAPALPDNLADAIDRCLAKLPEERFASAAQFVDAVKPLESQNAVPRSLIPAQSAMAGAKASLGWAAAIGGTTTLLMLSEVNHQLSRDIILAVGGSLAVFMAVVSLIRAGEALHASRSALHTGIAPEDAMRALAGEVSSTPIDAGSRKRNMLLIAVGVAFALAEAKLSRIEGFPELVEGIIQVGLLFGPAYLIARGTTAVGQGSKLRMWLHKRVELPIARLSVRLAGALMPSRGIQEVLPTLNAPTELVLGRAVNAAIERLPASQRAAMNDAAAAANGLAAGAERLRAQDLALQAAEREARQAVTDEERTRLLDQLRTERQTVQARLATTIAALETMRLDLLRLDAPDASGSGLTTHLGVVRDLAHRVDAVAELRAYLAHSTPTPV